MNIQPIIEELFHPIIMQMIGNDHKNCDWDLEVSYNYYTDDWNIFHAWYVRGIYDGINITEKTFWEASKKFLELVREANIDVILAYYSEEKWVEDDDADFDGLTYQEIIDYLDDLILEDASNEVRDTEEYKELLAEMKELIGESWIKDFEDIIDCGCYWEEWCKWCIDCDCWCDCDENKCEKLRQEDLDRRKNLKEDYIWVHAFIKSLHSGKELYSKYEWQFVFESDDDWEVLCFIDDNLFYTRFWGEEWVDYEKVYKRLPESIQWSSFGKDWKSLKVTKFISELDTDHIEAILKTQLLKKSLREVFEEELTFRKW